MTLKAEETKVVTIDDRTIAVDELPVQAQQLVAFYDDWKQRELEMRSQLMAMQSAMKHIANQIAAVVKQADEEARAETEVPADVAANDGGADA